MNFATLPIQRCRGGALFLTERSAVKARLQTTARLVARQVSLVLGYYAYMKKPPDNPEFTRFTEAMRTIMGVSKDELKRREEEEKRERRPISSASPVSVSSSTPVD